MRFKLFGYTVEITRTTKANFDSSNPFTWSKKDQRIALKKASHAVSACPSLSSNKIARIKAVRDYGKEWGASPGLKHCKEFVEANFENNGKGDLIQ